MLSSYTGWSAMPLYYHSKPVAASVPQRKDETIIPRRCRRKMAGARSRLDLPSAARAGVGVGAAPIRPVTLATVAGAASDGPGALADRTRPGVVVGVPRKVSRGLPVGGAVAVARRAGGAHGAPRSVASTRSPAAVITIISASALIRPCNSKQSRAPAVVRWRAAERRR